MTDIIIRHFVKDYKNTRDNNVRGAYGKLAGVVGILCNAVLFIIKLLAGILSCSVSITADAVNNLSDASSSVISLVGFKLASRPADEGHPYGHGRYEYLSGLMVAFIIMVIGFELLKSSIGRIIHPESVEFGYLSAAILAFSILIKLWMMVFNKKVGKAINSKTLIATAADSRNDVIATGAVLLAAIISRFAHIELDGFMGAAVALFILYSGFDLVRDTLDPMLGKAPDEEQVDEIREKILSYDGVLGTHDLLVHDYGPGRQFASVHVEMAAEGDVVKNHDIIDRIEDDFLKNDSLHMIVHFDPIQTENTELSNLRNSISVEIKKLDKRMTIHDLKIDRTGCGANVVFDCMVPHDMEIGEKEIKQYLTSIITSINPQYSCTINIDRSYAALPHFE
ncbi:MAG: cation transporter [Oscillospiraceae bacterium]|nr:cation transporter [Oscillospiraceae bacterium]